MSQVILKVEDSFGNVLSTKNCEFDTIGKESFDKLFYEHHKKGYNHKLKVHSNKDIECVFEDGYVIKLIHTL